MLVVPWCTKQVQTGAEVTKWHITT